MKNQPKPVSNSVVSIDGVKNVQFRLPVFAISPPLTQLQSNVSVYHNEVPETSYTPARQRPTSVGQSSSNAKSNTYPRNEIDGKRKRVEQQNERSVRPRMDLQEDEIVPVLNNKKTEVGFSIPKSRTSDNLQMQRGMRRKNNT